MTIKDYSIRCNVSEKAAKQWIQKGYVPGADLENDYVPDSARSPYTEARVKVKLSTSVFSSIMKATLKGKHVVPSLYNMCQEEFDSYINQLVEAGLISIRITDGITYYDPTLKAEEKNKNELKAIFKECLEAISKGVTSACLEKAGV